LINLLITYLSVLFRCWLPVFNARVAHDGHLYANEQWRFVQQMQNSIIGNFVDKLPDNLPFALKSRVTVSEFPSGGIASVFPPMYDRSVVKGLEGQPASTSRAPPSKKPPRREEEEEKEKQGHRGGRDHSPGRPGPGGHRRDDDENKKEDDERPGKPGPPPAAASPKKGEGSLIISMGRYGTLTSFNRRPADDAIIAMILSAKKAVRLALQDIGPVCIPGTKVPLPGTSWPKNYLSALGKVIWTKGVDVEIVLSNPASIPGGLSKMEACYGNGWSCSDVAAEIIKTMKEQFPSAADDESKLQNKLVNNLRVSFLRSATGQKWEDGMTLALHSKHMIVDESAYLVGSQNLYVCDLAEWGVVVDDEAETKKVLDEYWGPMWKASYTPDDCDVREVMEGLDKDRNGEDPTHVSEATQHLLDTPENKHLLNDGKGGAVVRPSMKNNKFFNEED
jgi:phosphatidylserine/phosphatidylglycerophosphate/cardiolipin synthase-like enzyme